MDRISRKELKKDRFAQEVGHTFEFLETHRKQLTRYGALAAALIILGAGFFYYNQRQRTARQEALRTVLTLMQAPVGPSPAPGIQTFATADEKNKAVTKALTDLAAKYAGSSEADVAEYYLGSMAIDAGRMDEAARRMSLVANSGNRDYASLARLSLAGIYASQGKTAEAEKLLRQLVDQPTTLVPKDEAILALAKLIAPTRPDEARKLLEPLRSAPGSIGRLATAEYGELPGKK